MADHEYISTEEAGGRLNYTPQHVSRLVRSGKLEGKKVGRDWIVVRESVERYASSRANYSLPLESVPVEASEPSAEEEGGDLSFEKLLSGGEPSLAQKRRAKELAWSSGAAPAETRHRIFAGGAREIAAGGPASVHLVVTSPPVPHLLEVADGGAGEGPEGPSAALGGYLDELDSVWRRCFEVLVPGGRMCIVLGDVCVSRKAAGRHRVLPLHAHVAVRCEEIGFDYLTPILWSKSAALTEPRPRVRYLGKPYEPNSIIKNELEYILLLRKPGSYRRPSAEQRALSLLEPEEQRRWFRSVWTDIRGESRRAEYAAPFPKELAYRLIRMFSFVGDTVLDPFWRTGSTTAAAAEAVRSSIGFENDPKTLAIGRERLAELRPPRIPARFEFPEI